MKCLLILFLTSIAFLDGKLSAEPSEEDRLRTAAETQQLWRYTTAALCLTGAGLAAWGEVAAVHEVRDCKRDARAAGKSETKVEDECHALSTGSLLTLAGVALLGLGIWALVDPWETEDRYEDWKKLQKEKKLAASFFMDFKASGDLGMTTGMRLVF